MLTKSLGLCLLAVLIPLPAAPQTSPDMQKILERLDKLEGENQKLLDEIRQLRGELRGAGNPDRPGTVPRITARVGSACRRLSS